MRRLATLSSFALALGVAASTVLGFGQQPSSPLSLADAGVAHAQSSAFQDSFTGKPSGPTPYRPADWDILVHSRDVNTWQQPESMMANHGSDCAGHPASHPVSTYQDTVFQCNDHLMTAINASGYGAIYMAPNQLVDFSNGEATIRFNMSTMRTSTRDWIDVWVTPFEDNVPAPLDNWLPDLTGLPKRAIHIRMDQFNGDTVFKGDVIRNFSASAIDGNWWTGYESFLTPSAIRRDTFELKLSRTSVKFGMPGYNHQWTNSSIPALDWTRGVVQFSHHSYNPTKDCPTSSCAPNTWHWDDVSVSPSVPYTILSADRAQVLAGGPTATFAGPAPADSYLRFLGIGGNLQASYDGGPWQNLTPRQTTHAPVEAFKPYWVSIPAGTQQVTFRGNNWFGGPWAVTDPAIWSLAAPGGQPAPVATATPAAATATATSTPASQTSTATPTTTAVAATATQVLATATPTSAPATSTTVPATSTAVPATATSLPATATPTSAPATATPVAPNTYTSGATLAPANVAAGGSTTVTAAVTSSSAASALVDVEIYSASGVKVHQQWFDNQTFAAGQQRTFPVSWNVPAGAAAGQYTVVVGTFSPGWGTNYHWNGNAATVSVTAGSDVTPPVISNIAITKLTRQATTIAWTTNEPATRRVEYGTTPALGQVKAPNGINTNHSIALSGLTPNTTYHYRVISQDADGNVATSSMQTVTTKP